MHLDEKFSSSRVSVWLQKVVDPTIYMIIFNLCYAAWTIMVSATLLWLIIRSIGNHHHLNRVNYVVMGILVAFLFALYYTWWMPIYDSSYHLDNNSYDGNLVLIHDSHTSTDLMFLNTKNTLHGFF